MAETASSAAPERSAERDAAIDAMLPFVAEQGWTASALRSGLVQAGADPDDAVLLFPGGVADMLETFCDLADRRMEQAALDECLGALRVSQRVRAVVAIRLRQNEPWREPIRRALALMAWPPYAGLAARTLARTVDSMWHAAGDTSADFSWYTKRGLLAAVYSTTLLFWLRDYSDDQQDTLAFLDRRLAGVARIGRLRSRLGGRPTGNQGRSASVPTV